MCQADDTETGEVVSPSALQFSVGGEATISSSEIVHVDYLSMDGASLYSACGTDAAKWTAAFCQHAAVHGFEIDADWVFGWFANAIMAQYDECRRQTEERSDTASPRVDPEA